MTMVKVQVDAPVVSPDRKANLLAAVTEEISEFDKWFQSLGNQPLVKSETAILKTYFAYKLGLAKGAEAPTSST